MAWAHHEQIPAEHCAQPCAVSAFSHGPGDAGGDLGEARDPWSHRPYSARGTHPVT